MKSYTQEKLSSYLPEDYIKLHFKIMFWKGTAVL